MKEYLVMFGLFLVIINGAFCNLKVLTVADLKPITTTSDIFQKNYAIESFDKNELTNWLTIKNIPVEKFSEIYNGIDNMVKDTVKKIETWEIELKDDSGKITHVLIRMAISDTNINLYSEYLCVIQEIPQLYETVHHGGSSSVVSGLLGFTNQFKKPWDEDVTRDLNTDEQNLVMERLSKKATEYVNKRKQEIGF